LTATRLLRENGVEEAVEGLKFALALAVEEARHRCKVATHHEEVWQALSERIENHGTSEVAAIAVGASGPDLRKGSGTHDSPRSEAPRNLSTTKEAPPSDRVRPGTTDAPRLKKDLSERQPASRLQTPRLTETRASARPKPKGGNLDDTSGLLDSLEPIVASHNIYYV